MKQGVTGPSACYERDLHGILTDILIEQVHFPGKGKGNSV